MPKTPSRREPLRPLGEVIREFRERAGLSQLGLAKALGMDQPAIARIESARRGGMQFATMCRVASALGVSLDEIAGRAGLSNRPVTHAPALNKGAIVKARKALTTIEKALDDIDASS